MPRPSIVTFDDLHEIAQEERESQAEYDREVRVCVASGCVSQAADEILEALDEKLKEGEHNCQAKGVGCMGLCGTGPHVAVEPDNVLYDYVKVDDTDEIVDSIGGEPVERLAADVDAPFFTDQIRIVLENSGVIDPESIQDYIAHGGYEALFTVLTEMDPTDVINEIRDSGLRGRGGGGYPTGLKWTSVRKSEGDVKYVICNADEGDPGAFMDRCILESDPHRVLEGMAIAGYAVGAEKGYIYIRAEYPLAIERLEHGIRRAKRLGVLGDNIFGSAFSFNVELRLGAGAFVCGEETALIASIEGKRGLPRPRPPYPSEVGLWGKPTLINNVETLANVAPIIRKGSAWYAGIGTEKSTGTKVFALTGQMQNTGLIEVPMGISLRQIVFDIGGGVPEGRTFKAVQTGGPSGGCIPEEHLDMPVDYESLQAVGSIMGSGGMIVMDDTSSMIDVAHYFMEFSKYESCGKCVPCRVGTTQMYNLLGKFLDGTASMYDLELLEQLCDLTKHASLCGLGQSAPNPVISTLRYFRHEYIEQTVDSRAAAIEEDGS